MNYRSARSATAPVAKRRGLPERLAQSTRAFCAIVALVTSFTSAVSSPPPTRAAARVSGGDVFYEIFVRSFQDSNGDGVGDLNGVTSRLADLQALGVNGIWLMPIFASASYHGYDTIDYRALQREYGTPADFDRLIAAAHARGIRVVLDLVINHTSILHPWFKSPERAPDYYVWRAQDPGWPGISRWRALREGLFYYGFFGAGMPDLNWRAPAVRREIDAIIEAWASRGVDGFRLDAPRYYVEGPRGESDTAETQARIHEFVARIRARFPALYFVGEVWADTPVIAQYVGPDAVPLEAPGAMDQAFHFPLAAALLDGVKNALVAALPDQIQATLQMLPDARRLATFITNHDQVRIASELARARPGSKQVSLDDVPRLKLAATALLTLPGTPYLYYGEEIGLPNGRGPALPGDLAKRTAMPWTHERPSFGFTSPSVKPWAPFAALPVLGAVADQRANPNSLWSHYRNLIALRRREPVLQDGALELLTAPSSPITAYLRRSGRELAVVVLGFSRSASGPITLRFKRPADLASDVKLAVTQWLGQIPATLDEDAGQLRLMRPGMPAAGAAVYRIGASN